MINHELKPLERQPLIESVPGAEPDAVYYVSIDTYVMQSLIVKN